MRVRAIAARSPESNAIGTVELECLPSGLCVHYLGVAAWSGDYAPSAFTHGTQVEVPWALIEEARLEGASLWLKLAQRVTPLNRLTLIGFNAGDDVSKESAKHSRVIVWFSICSATALLILALYSLQQLGETALGWLGLALAGVASLLLFVLGFTADRFLTRSPSEATLREAFVCELERYLPSLARVARSRPSSAKGWSLSRLQRSLPRSTAGIVITLSSCLLAALVTLNWAAKAPEPTNVPAAASIAATKTPLVAPSELHEQTPKEGGGLDQLTSIESVREGGSCKCERGDTLGFAQGIPRVSPLIIDRRTRPHKDHFHQELELGLVNNGDRSLEKLTLRVSFYETEPETKRQKPTRERPLYFEGPLFPGRAIKWHVQARGTGFELRVPDLGVLAADGADAAASFRFAELLKANHRPIRLHAASMLALIGDSRSSEAALSLKDALREKEAPYIERLLQSLQPLRTCQTSGSGTTAQSPSRLRVVRSCVYNGSSKPLNGVRLKARALSESPDHHDPLAAPPLLVTEQSFALPFELAPNSGRQITVTLDVSNADGLKAESFETVATAGEPSQQ